MRIYSKRGGAVLYDGLYVRGGAEQVTLQLVEDLDADLVCGFRDASVFPDSLLPTGRTRVLGRSAHHPVARTLAGLFYFRHRAGFLRDYDWVVYSGVTAPVAANHHREGRNVYYCHTPPRFVYDLRNHYLLSMPGWQRPLLSALIGLVQPRYEAAIDLMETIVANSENVRSRVQRFLGRDAVVVYPPCDTQGYRWLADGDYFLSTARLEPYKRVDLILAAFLQLPSHRLIVASGGSDERRLRQIARGAANIDFVGWRNAEQLRELVGRARATIYVPRDEDFGMSPVESMAAGKPVIGVSEGGLLETVRDGETGLLLPRDPDCQGLVEAVLHMRADRAHAMRVACEERAQLFSLDTFRQRMREIVFA
jgi:glycosyltransferase involved in cell wall biosynthesis